MIWRPPRCKSCGERSWKRDETTDEEIASLSEKYPDQRGWKKNVCANCGYVRLNSTMQLL